MYDLIEFIDTSDPIFWGCESKDVARVDYNYGTIPHNDRDAD